MHDKLKVTMPRYFYRSEIRLPSKFADFGPVGGGGVKLQGDAVMKTTDDSPLENTKFQKKLSEEKDTFACYSTER